MYAMNSQRYSTLVLIYGCDIRCIQKSYCMYYICRYLCTYSIPRNSNSQKKLGVCENWVFTCRFRCFRRFSQKLVVFWGLHSLAYTDQLEVTQRLYGRFLPLIMVFCEQILGLWGKTEPCRDLLFHTSMAKEVGMWPSEFTQHE